MKHDKTNIDINARYTALKIMGDHPNILPTSFQDLQNHCDANMYIYDYFGDDSNYDGDKRVEYFIKQVDYWLRVKYAQKDLEDVKTKLERLIHIGEDYGVFESAQIVNRNVKKAYKLVEGLR